MLRPQMVGDKKTDWMLDTHTDKQRDRQMDDRHMDTVSTRQC